MSNYIHIHQLSDHAQQHERDADTPLVNAILLVPSSGISCFELDAVDIPKRYLKQALPNLLEDKLIEPLEALHLSYTAANKHKSVHTIVAKKQVVQEWLDAATASGINATAIVPDFYSLPINATGTSLSFNGDYGCVRSSQHAGFSGTSEEVCALLKLSNAELHLYGDDAGSATELSNLSRHDYTATGADSAAINLRQGNFANKQHTGNRYTPYRWPLALAAALLLSMTLHLQLEARYLASQNTLLNNAIGADYKTIFKKPIEPNWQTPARYKTALAKQQLRGENLGNWQLLRHVNEAISACRDCVIEEFSLNQQGALLTVNSQGSAKLISAINAASAIKLSEQKSMESNITLSISLGDKHG